jgi:hypothetical protein
MVAVWVIWNIPDAATITNNSDIKFLEGPANMPTSAPNKNINVIHNDEYFEEKLNI